MKHISKIQREHIPNILISEVMEGGKGIIKQKVSKIDLLGNGPSVTTEVIGDGNNEAIKEHMKSFGERFFANGWANEIELHVLYPDLEKYMFPAQPIFLEKAKVHTDAGSAIIEPAQLAEVAPTFGMVSMPLLQPPTCLLYALHQKNKEEINEICKSFSHQKSMYGKINISPEFVAILGVYSSEEDAEIKWSMEAK